MRRFPVICGPTAGGKSAAAVALAQRLIARAQPAEILTADAYQIYRGMDIGTAKPTAQERAGIPHHLLDLVEPESGLSVAQWLDLAQRQIADCRAREVVPIVVGGTHLYIKALLDGLFEGPGTDEALRAELMNMDPGVRREELRRVDPDAAGRIHPNDVRRTVRALEVFRLTGTPISRHQRQWDAGTTRDDAQLVTLTWPVESLNRRINERVRAMMRDGLLEEVRALGPRLGPQAREALGYKQLLAHLRGECPLDDAVEQIKIQTRRLAKNQRTWLGRLRLIPGTLALDASTLSPDEIAQRLVDTLDTHA